MLGGKHGVLAPAREGAFYGNGLYWANHVRFLWREHGANWVATLHTFGEAATERLLGRLIASLRLVAAIPRLSERGTLVGVTPSGIAFDGSSLWVASLGDLTGNFTGTVYRVDSASGRVTGRIRPHSGSGPHALALLDESLWVATDDGIARIDPRTTRRTAFLNAGRFPRAITAAGGLLWIADSMPFAKNGSLVSVDPDTNRVVGRAIPLGRAPGSVTAGARSLWVTDELDGTLTRIDPRRRRVDARINVGQMPTAAAVGAGAVWVANTGDGTISRVDPATNRIIDTIRVGRAPRALAVDPRGVWVAVTGDGALRKVERRTGRVSMVRRDLEAPLVLASYEGTLWLTTNEGRLIAVRS